MIIFNHLLNEVVTSKSNIYDSIISSIQIKNLRIIFGKVKIIFIFSLIMFTAGTLFAQTETDLSASDTSGEIIQNTKTEDNTSQKLKRFPNFLIRNLKK